MISIITPVYNGYCFLEKFLKSFEKQTKKCFEILFIDDSSSDDSYNKLLAYKNNSNMNIRIFKTSTNSGPGTARNIGLLNASGEWITFVDCDDAVDTVFVEELNSIAITEQCDCVIFDRINVTGNRSRYSSALPLKKGGLVERSFVLKNQKYYGAGYLFKMTILREFAIMFPEVRRYEDIAFCSLVVAKCNKLMYLKKPLYFYVQRRGSLSNNIVLDFSDMEKVFDIVEKNLNDKYSKEVELKQVKEYLYGGVLLKAKASCSNRVIIDFIEKFSIKFSKWNTNINIKEFGVWKSVFLFFVHLRLVPVIRLMSCIHTALA